MKESEIYRFLLKQFKQCRFHYGYIYDDPGLQDNIIAIDFWTNPLGQLSIGEYSLAFQIAKKYSVNLIQQDFSKGEDQKPIYKPVFATTCRNITKTEIKEKIRKLDLAERELKAKIQKIFLE